MSRSVYALCPLAAQLFLYGDSLQDYLILFVVPEPEAMSRFVARVTGKPVSSTDLPALGAALQDPKVIDAALKEFNKEASRQSLKG